MLEFTASSGTNVKIRHAELDDAPSMQRNCLSANTIDEVRRFLEKDVEEMEKGNKVRPVAEVDGEVVGNLEIFFSRHPLSSHIVSETFFHDYSFAILS